MRDLRLERAEAIVERTREFVYGITTEDATRFFIEDARALLSAYDDRPKLLLDELTPKTRRLLIEIVAVWEKTGAGPTTRELAETFTISGATVGGYVQTLRAFGWLRSDIRKQGGCAIAPTTEAVEVVLSSKTKMVDRRRRTGDRLDETET